MKRYLNVQQEMGTRYIINALNMEFRGVLEKALKEGCGIDLCHCKLGPYAAGTLQGYYGSLDIIDSNDKEMNKILQHNCSVKEKRNNLEEYSILDFSSISSLSDLVTLLNGLKSNGKYKPVGVTYNKYSLSSLVYCLMVKPEIDFDITDYLPKVYDFVRNEWITSAKHHDKYILLTRPDYIVLDCVNGYVDVPGIGEIQENNFINSFDALPYEFGTKNIVEYNSKGRPVGEWAGVINKILINLGRRNWKNDSILTKLEYNK